MYPKKNSYYLCAKIAVIKSPTAGTSDSLCWGLTNNGQFTLKTAYFIALDEFQPSLEPDPIYSNA